MLRGIYIAGSAMMVQEAVQSVIANNLANVNTTGFKGDVDLFESYRLAALTRTGDGGGQDGSGPILGTLDAGVSSAQIAVDLTDGPVKQTGNPLDVAARGNQYFVVQTPQGDRLTRAGEFLLGGDGTLTTSGGYPVQGKDGRPIRLDGRGAAAIGADGAVTVDNKPVANLRVVELAPGTQPQKEGNNLLRVDDPAAIRDADRPNLVPGALESSNVTVVEEMVGMINAMRAYEAAQKAVQSQDDTLGKALNEVAKA